VSEKDATILAVFFVGYIGGIAIAWFFPYLIKSWHIARQNRLIEQCRTDFILAFQHVSDNNEATARELLDKIRANEKRWQFGNSLFYRAALGFVAVGLGACAASLLRLADYFIVDAHSAGPSATLLLATVGMSLYHTLASYFTDWHSPWIIDDCGDRLEALLNAGRGIAITSPKTKRTRLKDGLAAYQVFGLSPVFTLKELNAARRRMANQYHPDRWQNGPASAAKAAEEAMKRINVAYDKLKPNAEAA
jgi:hypothetical protein